MTKITLGGHIREVGSTEKYKTGAWRTFYPELDDKKCIRCGTCWIFCPEGCIYREKGKMKINLDYCKGCGICANECPTGAIKMLLEEK